MPTIKVTNNFRFLSDLPAGTGIALLEGSTRSSKTYSILQYLCLFLIDNPKKTVRCFRHDGTTHSKTTIPDFKDVMITAGLWEHGRWNVIDKEFRFNNGSLFAFGATNDDQKLHGAKQDIAWLNEVMEISSAAYAQIAFRTSQLTIMDWNPSLTTHWVFDMIGTRNVAYKHSTYKDNPFLSGKQLDDIEKYDPDKPENIRNKTADSYRWAVYGKGERGKVKGAIYQLWDKTDFFPNPQHCQRHGYALDFGFSNDPAALVECALFQNRLYIRELIYETNLLITPNISDMGRESIQSKMEDLGIPKYATIYADSAMPSAIEDLRIAGYNIQGVKKYPNSIIEGIEIVQGANLHVDRGSNNIQTELEHYQWKRLADGTWSRVPIDRYNHALDAVRYWCMSEMKGARRDENNDRGDGANYRKPTQSAGGIRKRKQR